jgi:hypothetical protein
MRELLIDLGTTLDGYASGEGWPGWWGLEGPEYLAWVSEQPPVTYLMGANTYRLMSGFASGEMVRAMKEEGSGILSTLGSISLCRSLLKAGLVDRFRVVVFPVITGATGAERIYDGYPDVALDMVSTRTFDGRIQLLEGVPRVLAGPPGVNNNP